MTWHWNFPAIDLKGEYELGAQLDHIAQELDEACMSRSLMRKEADKRGRHKTEMIIEVLDIIHACETLLRNEPTGVSIDELAALVEMKNARSGYYGESYKEAGKTRPRYVSKAYLDEKLQDLNHAIDAITAKPIGDECREFCVDQNRDEALVACKAIISEIGGE